MPVRQPSESPGITQVIAAAERIRSRIVTTPVVRVSRTWIPREDVRLHLKLECRQRSGSFKARGASNFLARLCEVKRPTGVVTYSSGNHGRAVAEAARDFGLPVVVTVPDDVDESKAEAIAAAGAEVVRAGPTSSSRQEEARKIAESRGFEIVPPFDHPWIVEGQGTVALEIVEQVPDVTAVWIPVGGGGLAAGTAVALAALRPEVRVYAVEPAGAAGFAESQARGARTRLESAHSVADGLLPLAIGEINWRILQEVAAESVVVADEIILASLRRLRRDLQIETEPSGAVAPAPLFFPADVPAGNQAGPGAHVAIVSGGNVAADRLARLLEE